MLTDAALAITHHLLAFALAGVLVAETMLVRSGMGTTQVRTVAHIDIAFGVLAGLILVVGIARVYFGAKGPDYYWSNLFFYAKLGALVAVAILSTWPTRRFIAWRRATGRGADFAPPSGEVENVRRFIHLELVVFFSIPVFAALMARGYGIL